MESKKIQVFYPLWIKILGTIGLPILAMIALWLSLRPLYEVDLTDAQRVLFPLLGMAVLYQCIIGFRCFRNFNTVLVLHDIGVDVYHKGQSKEYKWDDLIVKEYSFATTTHIKSKSGETVGYFSNGLPNLQLLVDTIENGST